MLLARLCNTVSMSGIRQQRRHSWSSEFDYHLPEPPPPDDLDDNQHFDNQYDAYSSDDDISSDKDDNHLEFDLIAVCQNVITVSSSSSSSSSEDEEKHSLKHEQLLPSPNTSENYQINSTTTMGQTSSFQNSKPKLSLTWVLRNHTTQKNVVNTPEPPIKFQYSKTRRKNHEITSKNDSTEKRNADSLIGDNTLLKRFVKRDEKNTKIKSLDKVENKFIRRNSSSKSSKQKLESKKSPPHDGSKEQESINNYYYDDSYNEKYKSLTIQTDKLDKDTLSTNNNLTNNLKSVNKTCDYNNIIHDHTKTIGTDTKNISDNIRETKYLSTIITKESKNVYTDPRQLIQRRINDTSTTQTQNKINSNNNLSKSTRPLTVNNTKDSTFTQIHNIESSFPLKKRTSSEPTLISSEPRQRVKQRYKRRSRSRTEKRISQFGYDIEDIDSFLTKASLEKPANIPVVLSYPSMLYQTQYEGYQDEVPLPLGMVVNAVFKKESWLYVQTPHGEEGYVSYSACLPLGIIPHEDEDSKTSPCWETSTDLFPRPCGNMTDSEKLTQSECGGTRCKKRVKRNAASVCGERSVDRLYLRAAANTKVREIKRQTLLVIDTDYSGRRKNTISVSAGDVVALISAPVKGWFWIRTRDGSEGFIPASIAGHGYL